MILPALAILISISIYLLTRSQNLLLYHWLEFDGWLTFYKVEVPTWLYWFVYSLPDGLWLFSFTSILLIIHSDSTRLLKLMIGGGTLIVGLIHEAGQAINLLAGTFDWFDLVTYVVFWSIAFAIYSKKGGFTNATSF